MYCLSIAILHNRVVFNFTRARAPHAHCFRKRLSRYNAETRTTGEELTLLRLLTVPDGMDTQNALLALFC